jgi:hypothetical protein
MIAHFTRIIYLDYRGFDYCGNFRGNNNRDNRGIPVFILIYHHHTLLDLLLFDWKSVSHLP